MVAARPMMRAAVLYTALTFVLAYPLTMHPATAVLSDSPDKNLEMWALAWDAHAFVHQPLAIFDANIYYPERRTLAYSENFIGSAIVAAPIVWLTGNLVLALNAVSLLSCVLCGVGAYALAKNVGVGEPGALIAGLVFAFSPPRFLRLDQLHLTTIQWVPFALASLHAYLDRGRPRDLRLFIGLVTLQAFTSGHGAVFLLISSAIVVAYRGLRGESIDLRRRLNDVGITGVLLFAPTFLLVMVYARVQAEMGLRRPLGNWGVPIESFVASPTHVHAWLLAHLHASRVNDSAGAYLFPGALTLILAMCAVVPRTTRLKAASRVLLDAAVVAAGAAAPYRTAFGPVRLRLGAYTVLSVREASQAWLIAAVALIARLGLARTLRLTPRTHTAAGVPDRHSPVAIYGVVIAVSVWISIGPPLGAWPFLYWLPGFNFIRVPSRFMLLAVLGIAVLAGVGFERATARVRSARPLLALIAGALLVGEWAAIPFGIVPARVDVPAIDRWIRSQPPAWVIAEVPLASPRNLAKAERRHTTYMLHSTVHWRKTVEGYSGFRPKLHEWLYEDLTAFPDAVSLGELTALGVTHVVVHVNEYEAAEWSAVRRRIDAYGQRLRLEHEEDGGRVYSIHAP